jgi:hypothetical protein
VHLDRVEGYEGNGLPTVNDEDYNERFIKIYFSYDNTCWYCNEDITNADAFFCEEFDTNIHHDCLLKEMK